MRKTAIRVLSVLLIMFSLITGMSISRAESRYPCNGTIKKNDDEVLDTNWTYLVGDEGIEPQESKTFSVSVPRNKSITKFQTSIIDYKKQ